MQMPLKSVQESQERGRFIAAIAQVNTGRDYQANLKSACELIDEAVARGASLVCFSENWAYQGEEYRDYAQEIPGGEVFNILAAKAKEHNIWIHAGSYSEKNPDPDDPRPLNTTVIIDPQGNCVSKYTKIHVYDADLEGAGSYRESEEKKPGNEIVVTDAGKLGKWGMSICYDIRFPEMYRIMAMEGADILFAPSSFMLMSGKDHWEVLLRARAIENSCYVIAADQVGMKWDGPTYGRSLIVDPWGNVIAKAPDKACVITAEIDLDYRMRMKRQLITLENRRPDVYTLERTKK